MQKDKIVAMELREKAYAKLNLGLDVLRRMENGYHELLTVMQSVSLCDEIRLRLGGGESITASTNLKYLPRGEKNLAVRAALLFFNRTGLPLQGGEIEIVKNIPVGAGMAGGSSDAAAVLRALNRAFKANLSRSQLEEMALELGSDVPFCVAGGTALCRGRGEIMTQLPPMPRCWVVVCKPSFSISTPELFSLISCSKIKIRPDMDGIVKGIERGDLTQIARRIYNVFEDFLPPQYSEVRVIKSKLINLGALGASMTGTGSAVYGLFDCHDGARSAYDALRRQYHECFIAVTTEKLEL